MDDLKIPIILLVCILGGVGYYFFGNSQKAKPNKIKPEKKIIETTNKQDVKIEDKTKKVAEEQQRVIEEAKKSFEEGRYQKTLELLAKYHSTNNNDINRMLAHCYSSSREFEKAISYFEKFIEQSNIPEDSYTLAYLYEVTNKTKKASDIYLNLAELSLPRKLKRSVYEGIARLSSIYQEKQEYFRYLQELVEEWPNSKYGIISLIKYKQKNNNYDDLEKLSNLIDNEFPDNYSYNFELARLLDQSCDFREAIKYYKKCIKLDSNNYMPFLYCYHALNNINKPEAAIKALEYFIDGGVIYPDIFFKAALDAHKLKLFRQAFRFYLIAVTSDTELQGKNDGGLVSDCEAFIRKRGNEAEKILVNSFVCYLNGDYEYASSEIRRIKSDLNNSIYKNDYLLILDACQMLANKDKELEEERKIYEEANRAKEEEERLKREAELNSADFQSKSIEDLKELANKNSIDFGIQMQVAKELMRKGETAASKEYLMKAIRLNQSSFEPYLELSKINLIEHNLEEARKNIEEALILNPNNPEVLTRTAAICLSSNDLENAQKYGEKALSIAPNDSSAMVIMAKVYIGQQKFLKANEYIEQALAVEKKNVIRAELFKMKNQVKELQGNR